MGKSEKPKQDGSKKTIGNVDNNTPPRIFWAHLDRCPLSLSLSSGSRQCQGLLLSFQLLQSSANAFYLQLLRVQKYLMPFQKLDQKSFLFHFKTSPSLSLSSSPFSVSNSCNHLPMHFCFCTLEVQKIGCLLDKLGSNFISSNTMMQKQFLSQTEKHAV